MKVWITKHALTSGIEEIDSEDMKSFSIDGTYLSFRRMDGSLPETYSINNWYYDKDSAVARADKMRREKIESLKKQIKKLEDMKFG